jgi:hypothetical protein
MVLRPSDTTARFQARLMGQMGAFSSVAEISTLYSQGAMVTRRGRDGYLARSSPEGQ